MRYCVQIFIFKVQCSIIAFVRKYIFTQRIQSYDMEIIIIRSYFEKMLNIFITGKNKIQNCEIQI